MVFFVPLFNTVRPAPDELLLSYFFRLSEANAVPDIDAFISHMVIDCRYEKYSLFSRNGEHFKGTYTGLDFPVGKLLKALPSLADIYEDPMQFLFRHTLYPIYSSFLKSEEE